MSYTKKMFGLEGFPISDEEVMRILNEAQLSRKETVEIVRGGQRRTIKIFNVDSAGCMRDYEPYFAK